MTDTNGGADTDMQVDTDLVRQLAELLHENDLTEIEVEDGDRRIVVKRQMVNSVVTAPGPAAPVIAAPAPSTSAPGAHADEASGANHPGAVKSPMVGTVYMSGEPGAPPFVSPGSMVAAGDTLLIVEAMKVMNPITAPRPGVVTRILVQDAQPVEYDQPLVIIE